jgi:catechol 2,3-dioxygenase-like lactoylglutathione lyase family enzyme
MITSLNHIGFEVPDLEEARQFFVQALGFRVLQQEELHDEPDCFVWPEFGEGITAVECLQHRSGLRIALAEQQDIYQQLHPSKLKQPVGWRYHLALNVADLKAVKTTLREYPGVQIRSASINRVPPYVSIITAWGMYITLFEKRSPTTIAVRI